MGSGITTSYFSGLLTFFEDVVEFFICVATMSQEFAPVFSELMETRRDGNKMKLTVF